MTNMIININEETINQIKNPVMRDYARIYTRISQTFMDEMLKTGIDLDPLDDSNQVDNKLKVLRKKGASLRNDSKSVVVNQISPACVACQDRCGQCHILHLPEMQPELLLLLQSQPGRLRALPRVYQ
jgi:uncharacterized protein